MKVCGSREKQFALSSQKLQKKDCWLPHFFRGRIWQMERCTKEKLYILAGWLCYFQTCVSEAKDKFSCFFLRCKITVSQGYIICPVMLCLCVALRFPLQGREPPAAILETGSRVLSSASFPSQQNWELWRDISGAGYDFVDASSVGSQSDPRILSEAVSRRKRNVASCALPQTGNELECLRLCFYVRKI